VLSRRSALRENRDLVAGAAGGLFAPLATYALGLSIFATLPGALLVFLGVRMLLTPKGYFEELPEGKFAEGQVELARAVLTTAGASLEALGEIAAELRNLEVKQMLLHLQAIAAKVMGEIERDPARLMNVQRLLTYYLPSAQRLAEGYRALEQKRQPSRERVQATIAMIERLDDVFSSYSDRLVLPEVEGLDVELRLLDDAIREERLEKGAADGSGRV